MGARAHGPIQQGEFLRNLGIDARADGLKMSAPAKTAEIDAARERLTSGERTGMGRLFKAVGFSHPKLGVLPGF
jgi:SAM-dependent MidA family methyltransferase